jgi:hypothetical protein
MILLANSAALAPPHPAGAINLAHVLDKSALYNALAIASLGFYGQFANNILIR